MASEHLTGIILIGGAAKRLGGDKARIPIGNQTMLQHAIDRLSGVCSHFLVVTSTQRPPPAFSSRRPCTTAVDILPGLGPLAGIYTGLALSSTELNFVLACDMPLVNAELVRYLVRLAEGYQAVVPVVDKRPHTLHAVYRRECQRAMREALDAGELAAHEFLERVRVRYVSQEEMAPLDPHLLSFFNVNTPADLERARRLLAGAPSEEGQT